MDQYILTPWQIRLNEAKQRARRDAKSAQRTSPAALWEPVLMPVTGRTPASSSKSAETVQKSEDDVTPARPILEVPQASCSPNPTPYRNRFSEMTAGKKRKRLPPSPSPPAKSEEGLFISQDEDEAYVDQLETQVDVEGATPTRSRTSKSNAVASSSGEKQKVKMEQRPFAPPKKTANKKNTHHTTQLVETRSTSNPQDWYNDINMNQRYSRADLAALTYVISLTKDIEVAVRKGGDVPTLFLKLRKRIHEMEFYDFVSGVLLRKSKILEDNGLEAIFDSQLVDYSWDIRADALLLYGKWRNGVLDPHLLRGIETKSGKDSKQHNFTSRNIDKGYLGRVSPNYIGAGKLVNGQWWPLQICALRDGAHGDIEGGISGMPGLGACSVVVSGGGYANIDEGNILKYCGTSGKNGQLSAGTKLLKESFDQEKDIRVLRSASLNAKNPFRPSKGLRYDGVYRITGFEILDVDTAMYRFRLRRCPRQDPIRCAGVEQRPTDQELAEYAKIKSLIGGTK